MSYITTTYDPFSTFKDDPTLTTVEGLSGAQVSRLRKLYNEFNKDQVFTDIVPRLEETDMKLLAKNYTEAIGTEVNKIFKSFNHKSCEKRLNLDELKKILLEKNGLDFNSTHFVLQNEQNYLLYKTLYEYLSTNAIELFTEAEAIVKAEIQAEKNNDNKQTQDVTVTSPNKPLEKLQQIVSIILISLSQKNFIRKVVWPTKLGKQIVLYSFDQNQIKKSLDSFEVPKKNKQKRGELFPLFEKLFNPYQLSQTSQLIIGSPIFEPITSNVVKNIQREYRRLMNPEVAEKPTKAEKIAEKKAGENLRVETEKAQKQIEKEKIDLLNSDNRAVQYVDGNHVWEPTFQDQQYAISQLATGQVRFGVVQGVDDKFGVFIDTYQNHVKVRCLCSPRLLYDDKTLRTLTDKFGGVSGEKSTKALTQLGGKKDDKKDDKKDGKKDGKKEQEGPFADDVIMKFAKKQYQIGDRVSFVITKIEQPKVIPGKKQELKLPRVFVSFAAYNFRKFATNYSNLVTVCFKYLLYLKLIDIRNKLLFSKSISFYPPRFFEQIQQSASLTNSFSELTTNDSKLLAMQFDLADPTYLSQWSKSNKIPLLKEFKVDKKIMGDDDSNNDGYQGDNQDEDDENTDPVDYKVDLSKLTGEFGQYSDDEQDDEDDQGGDDDKNTSLNVIKFNIQNDPVLSKFFAPTIPKLTLNRNFNNTDGVGTKAFVQLHNHNGFTFKHSHSHPGLNSALFNAPTKQERTRISQSTPKKEESSQIYLQSINMLHRLMALQPYPVTSKFRLNMKSLDFAFPTQFERQLAVATFFGDRERYEYLDFHGKKHFNYLKANNKVKSKQLRAMVASVSDLYAKNGKDAPEPIDNGVGEYNFTSFDDQLLENVNVMFGLEKANQQKAEKEKLKRLTEKAEKSEKNSKAEKTEKFDKIKQIKQIQQIQQIQKTDDKAQRIAKIEKQLSNIESIKEKASIKPTKKTSTMNDDSDDEADVPKPTAVSKKPQQPPQKEQIKPQQAEQAPKKPVPPKQPQPQQQQQPQPQPQQQTPQKPKQVPPPPKQQKQQQIPEKPAQNSQPPKQTAKNAETVELVSEAAVEKVKVVEKVVEKVAEKVQNAENVQSGAPGRKKKRFRANQAESVPVVPVAPIVPVVPVAPVAPIVEPPQQDDIQPSRSKRQKKRKSTGAAAKLVQLPPPTSVVVLPTQVEIEPKQENVEPKKIEPKQVEQKKVEPKQAEPKVEPKKAEPKQMEPKKVEPKAEPNVNTVDEIEKPKKKQRNKSIKTGTEAQLVQLPPPPEQKNPATKIVEKSGAKIEEKSSDPVSSMNDNDEKSSAKKRHRSNISTTVEVAPVEVKPVEKVAEKVVEKKLEKSTADKQITQKKVEKPVVEKPTVDKRVEQPTAEKKIEKPAKIENEIVEKKIVPKPTTPSVKADRTDATENTPKAKAEKSAVKETPVEKIAKVENVENVEKIEPVQSAGKVTKRKSKAIAAPEVVVEKVVETSVSVSKKSADVENVNKIEPLEQVEKVTKRKTKVSAVPQGVVEKVEKIEKVVEDPVPAVVKKVKKSAKVENVEPAQPAQPAQPVQSAEEVEKVEKVTKRKTKNAAAPEIIVENVVEAQVPVSKRTKKSVEKPVEKPVEEPVEEPVEQAQKKTKTVVEKPVEVVEKVEKEAPKRKAKITQDAIPAAAESTDKAKTTKVSKATVKK
jgi:hypothetical protein